MNQAVTLTFSLKYLVNFSKSSSLSKKVQLMMSNDVPLLVCVVLATSCDCVLKVSLRRCRMASTRASSGTTWHRKSAMTRRSSRHGKSSSVVMLAISLLSHLARSLFRIFPMSHRYSLCISSSNLHVSSQIRVLRSPWQARAPALWECESRVAFMWSRDKVG